MGEWMKTIVQDHAAYADGTTSVTVDLPTSNFIGKINIRFFGTGGSGTIVVDDIITKVELVANGSAVLCSASGADLRRFATFDTGIVPTIVEATSGDTEINIPIHFGRTIRDTLCILPAKVFKSLQLKITTGTVIAATVWATNTVKLSVVLDEYVSDEDPLDKLILKKTEINSHTSAAQTKDVELPLGNPLRRAMVFCTNGQADLTKIYVRINNGTRIPYTTRFDMALSDDFIEYGLHTIHTDVVMVDFDPVGALTGALPTATYNDLKLRYDEASGSTIRTCTEEIVRLTRATRV